MIIPLGHDQLTLRRWPVVSFALIALCLAVFVAGAVRPQPDRQAIEEALGAALSYYVEHPELEADPRLRQALEFAIAAEKPLAQEEIRRRLSTRPRPSALDGERQRRLDQLTGAWLAAVQVGPVWEFGLVPAHPSARAYLTHLFVHVGVLHLLFNMLFLYLSGPSLEDVWGRTAFALFYLAAGVASAAFFVAQYPDLAIPLVGASGAIAGLMGAFFVRFPRAEIRIFYLWVYRVGTTTIPAWAALLLWVLGELFSAFLMDRVAPGTGGAGVAHWGHVAGFVFGAAFALGARAIGLEERIEARASREDPLWRDANRALARDDKDGAWRVLRERMLRHPSDDDAALVYWDLAQQLGRVREATPVVLRLIRTELTRNDEDSALRHWDELKARVPEATPAVDLAVRLAESMLRRRANAETEAVLRDALEHVDATTPPQVVADLATTAAVVDRALAAKAAARALTHPALPREARMLLEPLVLGAPTPDATAVAR